MINQFLVEKIRGVGGSWVGVVGLRWDLVGFLCGGCIKTVGITGKVLQSRYVEWM